MPFPEGSSSTNEDAVVASYRDKDSRNRLKPLSYPSQEEEEKEEEEKRERERYRVVGEFLFCLEKNSRDRGEFSGTEYPGWMGYQST